MSSASPSAEDHRAQRRYLVDGQRRSGLPATQKFDLPIAGILHTDSHHFYRDAQPGESEVAFVDRIIGNLNSLIQAEGPETIAAFIAEPIPGVGGVIIPPRGYYEKLQGCQMLRMIAIDDEVVCGFGRTGKPLARKQWARPP
jgi:4-aminobutyrate--pyruvate transaminase